MRAGTSCQASFAEYVSGGQLHFNDTCCPLLKLFAFVLRWYGFQGFPNFFSFFFFVICFPEEIICSVWKFIVYHVTLEILKF